MKNYIEQIKDYLDCQPTGREGALLEILYFAYLDKNTGDRAYGIMNCDAINKLGALPDGNAPKIFDL